MAADDRIEVQLDTDWSDVRAGTAGSQPGGAGGLHRATGPLLRLRRRPVGLAHLDFDVEVLPTGDFQGTR